MKYKIGDLVSIKVREDFFEVRYPLDPELQGVIGVITEFIDVQQMYVVIIPGETEELYLYEEEMEYVA
jgi:hypothetical protein